MTGGRSEAGEHVVVDGWAHCGIRHYQPADQVLAFLDAIGAAHAVLAQPLGDEDNDYLLEVAASHARRVRVVGFVNAQRDDRADALAELAARGAAGVRIQAADLAQDPGFAREAAGAGLVVALHAPDGLAGVVQSGALADPLGPVVICHLGMPLVEAGDLKRGREVLDLASQQEVRVLVSGLAMFSDYPYEPLADLVADVLQAFGPDRVLWGSNFPLVDARQARRELSGLQSDAFCLDGPRMAALTGGNAGRLWFEDG